jgi:hypothetical protein
MTQTGSFLSERMQEIIAASMRRVEVAAAARLLVVEIVQPLAEAWWRRFPKVPPRLEDLMQARSDACAIQDITKVLNDLAAEDPSAQGDIFEQALGQAEEEMGALVDEGALTE